MPGGKMPGELLQAGFGENLRHQAHRLVQGHAPAIARSDARAFLAPVLEGVKAEIGQLGRVLVTVNAADAALMGGLAPFKIFHDHSLCWVVPPPEI